MPGQPSELAGKIFLKRAAKKTRLQPTVVCSDGEHRESQPRPSPLAPLPEVERGNVIANW
jgi:hypothetical protein